MWATCPRSASSGYHVEFHEVYQKHANPLNCRTSSSDVSGYHADLHEGHGIVGEWQGRGMAWQGNGMNAAWHVWISLYTVQFVVTSWPTDNVQPHARQWTTTNCVNMKERVPTRNGTNLMHCSSSVYSVTAPLHVSGSLVAHHQEAWTYRVYQYLLTYLNHSYMLHILQWRVDTPVILNNPLFSTTRTNCHKYTLTSWRWATSNSKIRKGLVTE
jgi:hypothetical protein